MEEEGGEWTDWKMQTEVSRLLRVNNRVETVDPLQETNTHSNQCAIRFTRGPFIYSVLRAVNPPSVVLTSA